METQLLRARTPAATAALATIAQIRNQGIRNQSLTETADIAPVILTMDIFTLWWISQWVDERKSRSSAAAILAYFRSYKEWVRTSQARMTAGMDGSTNTAPATPE